MGTVPPGSYAYGLNVVLPATTNALANNSKRVERDFILQSVTSAYMAGVKNYSIILGTEREDWFADYVRVETIMGDGALPHYLPGNGVTICAGDFIVIKARNDDNVSKRIALLFQGVHI